MMRIPSSPSLFLVLVAACFFLSGVAGHAADMVSPASSAQWSQAVSLHNQALAREGPADAAEKAVTLFKSVADKEPANAVAMAYLGSSYALLARNTEVLVDKVRYTNRGLRSLDKALELDADNFTVRMIRANVNLSLPEMFKRGDAAKADIEKLDQLHTAAPTRESARHLAPLYQAFAKSLGGSEVWEAKARAANQLAGQK